VSGEIQVQVYCARCYRDIVVIGQPSEADRLIRQAMAEHDEQYHRQEPGADADRRR
jgi:hypothetical protein